VNAKLLVGVVFCAASLVAAEPVKVKQAIGSVIRQKGGIQTGSSSRVELELPYFAVARIGSNADFKFSADAKRMTLKRGTMLLAMPQKTEGVSVESGSIVAAMTKGAFEMSNVGGAVKVISLDGKVSVANPSDKRSLRDGQMVDVPAGAKQMPPITAIKLTTLLKTSVLFNMGPLPNGRAIRQNATRQAPPRPFVTGGFNPDWSGGSVALTTLGPVGTAAVQQVEQQRAVQQQATQQQATQQQAAQQQVVLEQNRQRAAQALLAAAAVRAAQERVQQQQQQQAAQRQQQQAVQQQAQNQGQSPQGNQGQGPQGNQGNAFGPGGNPNQGNQGQGGGQGRQ
jgi:hypothetical protein